MKLVKIEDAWVNPEKIVSMYETKDHRTILRFFEDPDTDLSTHWPIEKVLQAIEGSQEHGVTSNDGGDIYFSSKNITY